MSYTLHLRSQQLKAPYKLILLNFSPVSVSLKLIERTIIFHLIREINIEWGGSLSSRISMYLGQRNSSIISYKE